MNWQTEGILKLIEGPVACLIDGERKEFSFGQEALDRIKGKYVASTVSADGGTVVIAFEEEKVVPNDMNANWVKEHIAQFGKEPNPFDGM